MPTHDPAGRHARPAGPDPRGPDPRGPVPQGLDPASLPFVESLYVDYLNAPASVSPGWRSFFETLERPPAARLGPSFEPASLFGGGAGPVGGNGHGALATLASASGAAGVDVRVLEQAALQDRVDQLVRAFRVRGHMIADLDPLGLPRPAQEELEVGFYGFTDDHLDRRFSSKTVGGPDVLTLRELLGRLRNTYCRSIGVQFMHIDDLKVKTWLQERMEATENRMRLDREVQLRILTQLTDAVILEEFIQKRFPGAKSFSLEGGESLIPLLGLAIERAGEQGLTDIVLGMSHRGRLNVLANIMGKSPRQIFREFADKDPELNLGRGDVKYHLGHSSDWITSAGQKVHLTLCFNPSHLSFVVPVALGRLRAKQDRHGDEERRRGMVIAIHGDAAFAGEGIIQETLNLSLLDTYRTGGTIHVIVNNQVGFTTPPEQARSTPYATDVARMLQSPIFHVNGEDPEAVAQVMRLAMDFRAQFQRDVVVDMWCYRRRGHNEGDEPRFTQPRMYAVIDDRANVREGYLGHLLDLGEVTREEADEIAERRREHLEAELDEARSADYRVTFDTLGGIWNGYVGGFDLEVDELATGAAGLAELLEKTAAVPDGFEVHPKIAKILEERRSMARRERPVDWSAAEALAFGSLAVAGHRIRLTGQDSERGTFSHRHSVLHDVATGTCFEPLNALQKGQALVEIKNSPLSEAGVLGFEYGYSLDYPNGLVAWEAQFGDFCNAAQVIIDQFIVSAEDKWMRLSGLTLLLPHGFEGAGPEHSSARLERWLTMAAEDNIQVVYPTTPAQIFHLLRRQVLRRWRKPLIVMTPKSLLRHKQVVSALDELEQGAFRRVIADERTNPKRTKRVVLVNGKLYYDLIAARAEHGRDDVAIVRVEQLYPFPTEQLRGALSAYRSRTPVIWAQEEPENMGAWSFMRLHHGEQLLDRFPMTVASRPPSASPATGSLNSHRLEQAALVADALGL